MIRYLKELAMDGKFIEESGKGEEGESILRFKIHVQQKVPYWKLNDAR